MTVSIEHIILATLAVALSIVGFFIIRSINQFDQVIQQHDRKLMKHDVAIGEIMVQIKTMQTAQEIHIKDIMEKLEYIAAKCDSYDANIRSFYEKYDLPIKK